MNTLLIRNLPEEVIRGIKEQAKQRGRTMEQEVRELLLGLYGQGGDTERPSFPVLPTAQRVLTLVPRRGCGPPLFLPIGDRSCNAAGVAGILVPAARHPFGGNRPSPAPVPFEPPPDGTVPACRFEPQRDGGRPPKAGGSGPQGGAAPPPRRMTAATASSGTRVARLTFDRRCGSFAH
jgi:plasmid stability protein